MKPSSHIIRIIPFCLLTANTLVAQQSEPTNPPNLVFIMADQWRGNAMGYMNNEPVITPNLDKLSKEGITFTNAISNYPVSSPARSMLMTGMYPISNKVSSNCNSNSAPYGVELEQDARCWSDVLHDANYDLAYIGKWHLDAPHKPFVDTANNRGATAWNEWCPPERRHGFSHWIAYGTYDNHLKPMYWNTTAERDSFYYVDDWGPTYETDRAIEYIENQNNEFRQNDKSFAIVVSMNPPHTGYHLVPDKYKQMYADMNVDSIADRIPNLLPKGTEMGDFYRNNLQHYYACMSGVDEQVGRLIATLKEQGLFENTIVVFSSDHGDNMGTHEIIGKNNFYEEAMRIPMIITYPKKIEPRYSKLNIAFGDLYPTLLSLMGYESEIPSQVETLNLAPAILDKKEEREVIQPYYNMLPSNLMTGYRGMRDSRYTFAFQVSDGEIEEYFLFDRDKDPYQLHNIASTNMEIVTRYMNLLKTHLTDTNDPLAEAVVAFKN